jgi:uracil phosphoribosyltransferase
MYRDDKTLEPVWYYDKTPVHYDNPKALKVYLLDPMLATGSSAAAAIHLFLNKGIPVENLTFISLLSSPDGINKLTANFPDLKIITAKIDKCLNAKAYIVPGLGDAGDRLFNTLGK